MEPEAVGFPITNEEIRMSSELQSMDVDFRVAPPKLKPVFPAWQAWWEDHDMWEGFIRYDDLSTAMHHAAVDYIRDEHGWSPEDDPADEAPGVSLKWVFSNSRWHLLADGEDTLVQLYGAPAYMPVGAPLGDVDQARIAVADARRAVYESLIHLPAWEADRVYGLIAELESRVTAYGAAAIAGGSP